MRALPTSLILLAILAAQAFSQELSKKPLTPATVDELLAAYEKDMNDLRAALGKEKDEKKHSALIERFRKTPQEYLPRVRKATSSAKGTPAEPRGLAWLFRKTRDAAEKERLLERLLAEFKTSEAMDKVCEELSYSRRDDAPRILEDLIANNPHRKVMGQACFALAVRLKDRFGRRRDPTPEARKRIEALLQRVIKDYADLPHFFRGTLGAAAKNVLFEVTRLAVGSIAPEIEGKDLDGVAFKLSDYRGTVVMLDFWGHW